MPENELQNQIYDCIAAVLGHRRFGIDTELYEAGLDSLGSVLLLTDLYQILKVSMTLNDLLQHASVLKLEEFAREGAGAEQVPRLRRAARGFIDYSHTKSFLGLPR